MIKVRKLSKLSEDELDELRKLTLHHEDGDMSYMHEGLKFPRTRQKHAIIITRDGKKIAWALLKVCPDKYDNRVRIHVYVTPEHRRKKIGTPLINKAKKLALIKWNKNVSVSPWDTRSRSFFQNALGRIR